MSHNSKNKFIYIISGVIIITAVCIAGAKFLLPDASSESNTYFHSSEQTAERSTLTKRITEFLTETVSQTLSTAASETNPQTDIKTTAKKTQTASVPPKSETGKATQRNPLFTLPSFNGKTTTVPVTPGDYSCFDNCAFIGNSRVLALKSYGLVKNVYAAVGLNVDTIFTKSAPGSSVPVIDELNGKHFDRVYIMLGDNECGWPNTSVFIKKYAKVIDAVRERVPEAEIYLQSILPISSEASAKNEYGCNNDAINNLNKKIKQLAADENVHYIAPAEALKNSEGALPAEAASDGVHMNKKYCKIWLDYLVEHYY